MDTYELPFDPWEEDPEPPPRRRMRPIYWVLIVVGALSGIAQLLSAMSAGWTPGASEREAAAAGAPAIITDVEIDEDRVCQYGYCGEDLVFGDAMVTPGRYLDLATTHLSEPEARDLFDELVAWFPRTKGVSLTYLARPCPDVGDCLAGEYDGSNEVIYLYDPTISTLLHEFAHRLSDEPRYVALDEEVGDWNDHSEGFEWALYDVATAYLTFPVERWED